MTHPATFWEVSFHVSDSGETKKGHLSPGRGQPEWMGAGQVAAKESKFTYTGAHTHTQFVAFCEHLTLLTSPTFHVVTTWLKRNILDYFGSGLHTLTSNVNLDFYRFTWLFPRIYLNSEKLECLESKHIHLFAVNLKINLRCNFIILSPWDVCIAWRVFTSTPGK